MENLKIRVNSKAESQEAQELFFKLGYKWFSGGNQVQHLKQSCSSSFGYLVAWSSGCFTDVIQCGCGNEDAKEITLPELRDLVVLKRNDESDATHTDGHYSFYVGKDKNYFFSSCDKAWRGTWKNVDILKPIEKPMKEYLDPKRNYELCLSDEDLTKEGMIKIPEKWMNFVYKLPNGDIRFSDNLVSTVADHIIWQRPMHPEELPFIDDEPIKRMKAQDEAVSIPKSELDKFGISVSLNDQYAEIEKVRQSAWQKQEGGNHYKTLKIQPMQYALENKLDYAQANVVKYVTRHKEKNGKEDLLKAIHNIELMIEFYYGGGE